MFVCLLSTLSPHLSLHLLSLKREEQNKKINKKMEKIMLSKVGSIKSAAGSLWITKKAKEELVDISHDISAVSNIVEEKAKWIFNKLKGKPTKGLPELLKEYNLPSSLFPENITCYEFDKTKSELIVHLPHSCEVTFKDSSVIRYATRVKAVLLRGKMMSIEGMKTKVLVWVKVTGVGVEGYKSDKVCITAGVKKCRPKVAYDTPPLARRVEDF